MITFILSSRFQGNSDNRLFNFLTSIKDCGGNANNCEVLIKFDTDDLDYGSCPSQEKVQELGLPFEVKCFYWNRGSGRNDLHLFYSHLFSERNCLSKYVFIGSDDFYFHKVGFIDELLAIHDDYSIIAPRAIPYYEWRDDRPFTRCALTQNEAEVGFPIDPTFRLHIGEFLPCFSTKLIEVTSGFGFQSNVDNWAALLASYLRAKFSIDIWRPVGELYTRDQQYDDHRLMEENYNNMLIDLHISIKNPYYFDLVEQQGLNVAMNIIHGLNNT